MKTNDLNDSDDLNVQNFPTSPVISKTPRKIQTKVKSNIESKKLDRLLDVVVDLNKKVDILLRRQIKSERKHQPLK